MQTFLPHASFSESARCLDYKRLGKQRVEASQILGTNIKALNHAKEYGEFTPSKFVWRNHPAVLMWRNYEGLLATYGAAMCREWKRRGYQDNLLPFFEKIATSYELLVPYWITEPEIFDRVKESHRSNLVFKDPEFYERLFPLNTRHIPYYWPSYSTPSSRR